MMRTLMIAGYGMAGHRLAEEVLALDADEEWRIVILGEELYPAYDRVCLSGYLDGRSRADLMLPGRDFLQHPRAQLWLGCPAVGGDPASRTVRTADGSCLTYDALVLATGSRPFVPPVPGHDLPGCFVYRTFDDLDAIRAHARPGRNGVVVGGGLLGLEAANALRLLGMTPHVVETGPHLMPAQLDRGAAAVLHRHVTGLGVAVHCGTATVSIDSHPARTVRSVTLSNGTVIDTPLVIFAAGVRPRDDLATALGLERADRGGFLTDKLCRTSAPQVWAVGDCAAVGGRCYGLVAPGYRMAGSVARQVLGLEAEPLEDIDTSTTLKLLGINVATFGATGHQGAMEAAFAEDTRYAKAVFDADTGVLLGGILAGNTGTPTTLQPFIGRQPPADLEQLLLPA
ncbi:nitrite reductase [Streptomyces hygroscopicus]|uniref:NAD(P)/FAD-dependent oxidoreductase n=1 Tax=Streptomyces hygroscopicus TaxID=1912 RepID=UPI00223F4F18|nr:FAD-dependent oxidoreductase [Streptomyces hygroscopicus]MCW7944412.1 nitrite reductase [Streptomyces hygroscopicus]